MRRLALLGLMLGLGVVTAQAQLGKAVTIRAGSPEDRALLQIEQESDLAKRVALLEQFVQEFSGDAALLGYRRLQANYLQLGELDKAILAGLHVLRLDPSDFSAMANLMRAFAQKQDVEQAFNYGTLAAGLIQRLKTMEPPADTSPEVWQEQKRSLLAGVQADYQYVDYTLYTLASQESDPAKQGELLERYLAAFSDSPYLALAYQTCLIAYQRLGNLDKVLEVGERALAALPDNLGLTLHLALTLAEGGQHLPRAQELAQKVPALADKMTRPQDQTEEQWASQQNAWRGLAQSLLGMILMHQGSTKEAIEKFREAEPLLVTSPVDHARNLYWLGFAYAKLGRLDSARRYLQEAVAIESPYQAAARELLDKVEKERAKRLY